MAKKKKNNNKEFIEIVKTKPTTEEKKFFIQFSETQLNAVLLIILASTFLVQGVTKYLEISNMSQYIRPWFLLTLFSMVFLVLSVVSISIGGVIAPLKTKRFINTISFITYILGFVMFLISLLFLIKILYG